MQRIGLHVKLIERRRKNTRPSGVTEGDGRKVSALPDNKIRQTPHEEVFREGAV